jgi:hypothetical protein
MSYGTSFRDGGTPLSVRGPLGITRVRPRVAGRKITRPLHRGDLLAAIGVPRFPAVLAAAGPGRRAQLVLAR